MNKRAALLTLIAAFALMTSSPGEVAAQQASRWSFDAEGGVAIPVSDLADFQDPGVTFGGGIAYWFTPRLAIRVDGDVDLLSGADDLAGTAEAPDLTLFHYNGGLELRLTDPARSRVNLTANVGAGATTFDSDSFETTLPGGGTAAGEFSQTYFTANGGLRVGYDVTDHVNIFLGGQAYLMFTDEDDTVLFESLHSDVEAFDTAWTIPLTAGVRIKI